MDEVSCTTSEPTGGLAGPGWYDSSWDLERGLEVREGLPADVQLNEWIALCMPGTGQAIRCAPWVLLPAPI